MSVEDLRRETGKKSLLYRIAPFFSVSGLMIVMAAFIVGLVRSSITSDYFDRAKATRDVAAGGSSLLDKLGDLHSIQAWLLPLEFVGLAALLVGIALLFSTIMGRIQLRAQAMAEVLPALTKQAR